ncbi:hypothetical protein D3C72_1888850 [compost metagenome]
MRDLGAEARLRASGDEAVKERGSILARKRHERLIAHFAQGYVRAGGEGVAGRNGQAERLGEYRQRSQLFNVGLFVNDADIDLVLKHRPNLVSGPHIGDRHMHLWKLGL